LKLANLFANCEIWQMNNELIHVTAEKGQINNETVIIVRCKYSPNVINQLRKIQGAYWNKSLMCWVGPYSKKFVADLRILHGITLEFIKADDTSLAKASAENKEVPLNSVTKVESKLDTSNHQITVLNYSSDEIHKNLVAYKSVKLSATILKDIDSWVLYLRSKQYAISSIKTYHQAMIVFASWLGEKNHKEVRKDDITNFMKYMVIERTISRSYQNQLINALKLFYKYTFSIHFSSDMIERPRREYNLPSYLTREEVSLIIQTLKYLKHRCIVSLMYACGLRNGEIIRIELKDIDVSQRLLIIRQSKGNKDRAVPIPISIINMLNDYCSTYKPTKYLFEGQEKGSQYTSRSVQQFFKEAVIKSGIRKTDASPHWLRHSYATHIMEMGTNLRDLQTLLGHKNLRTTEIYTHISATNFNRIISPFDTLPPTQDSNSLLDSGKKPYI